jgi:cAMP phosphodiesterase
MKKKISAYKHYRNDMRNLRRIGMVKKNTKVLNKEQFTKLRKIGLTRKNIIQAQTRYGVSTTKEGREVIKALMEKQGYKFTKRGRGYQISIQHVDAITGAITLQKVDKATANREFMNSLHDIITQRIDNGENREDVLNDYGYTS